MTVEEFDQRRVSEPVAGESSARRPAGWRRRLSQRRERLRRRRILNSAYRTAVGLVGFLVVVIGIIAIPYPGPGWAIFFLGMAILATEFSWAQRTLRFTKSRYDAVMAWLGRQSLLVQSLGAVLTAAVVVATLWVVGAAGWGAALVGLDWPWLKSPIGIGS